MSEEQVPFEVTEEVQVGDLTTVQTEILPACQNLRVKIQKANVKTSKDKTLKSLNVQMQIVDGIQVGEELRFKGKVLFTGFMDVCIWADPETKDSQWYKSKQHLLGFKQFCQALDIDLANVKINDEFLQNLKARELLISIVHEEETSLDEHGNRVKLGTFKERIKNFKKAV